MIRLLSILLLTTLVLPALALPFFTCKLRELLVTSNNQASQVLQTMPIIDNELVGVNGESSGYKPLVTCQTIVQKVRENIALHGDSTWMTDLTTGKSMSYAELANTIDRTSHSLRRIGFRPGDVLVVIAASHLEMPIIFCAAWKAGGGCSALDVGFFADDIRGKIIEAKAKIIVTDEQRAGKVLQATRGLDMQRFVIGQAEGYISAEQLLQSQDDSQEGEQDFQFEMDPPAWLTYSSGTTGKPKGIVHTHYSLSPYLQSDKARESEMVGQKFMFTHSMIHGTGLISFMKSVVEHRNSFTFSDANLEDLLQGIHSIKPSCVSMFPNELAGICLHPQLDRYDLTSVETIIYSGSANLPLFERQIFEKMPNLRDLISMYGMSETLLITLDNPKPNTKIDRNDIMKRHLVGCAGKVLPFIKLKIIDPMTGNKLGPTDIGEIHVHTPFLMKGYLTQTNESISGEWFNTGDQGYYDIEGNLFVVGRYKELIKYQSRKVTPSNIETQLMAHWAVNDVAVIGLPHDIDGEHPLACVVVRKDQQGRPLVTTKELIDFVNERVIDDEHLRGGIRFVENIPRNKAGKIMRHQLVASNIQRGGVSSH